jgi:lipopolysaccharide/colanic/teichoic acid biosynthesis glycosyltransferase
MKRSLDLFLSAFGLMASSPVLLILAILIKLDSQGPVFYRGIRVGKGGKAFRIFKFRTMVVNAEHLGPSSSADDDPRLTRIGRFLRRYKVDELPQLLNVLIGHMSLVGPRPQVQWAVELYTEEEKRLLSVRPGITDYASIRFRDEGRILRGSTDPDADYFRRIAPEKIRLGLEYVRNYSAWIDTKIILATVWAILGGNPETILRNRQGQALADAKDY